MNIVTEKFKLSQSKFIRMLIALIGNRWLWIPIFLILISATLSIIYDWRFAIVTLMVILILTPMLLAFFYIYYGLAEGCWQNILDHQLSFHKDKVEVKLFIDKKIGYDEDERIETIEKIISTPYSEIKRLKFMSDGFVIEFNSIPYGFLYVPFTSIENIEDSKAVIATITNYINSK